MKGSASHALLRELEGQRRLVEKNREVLRLQLAELDGQEEMLRTLEARLRGGMVDGFERIGMEQAGGAE